MKREDIENATREESGGWASTPIHIQDIYRRDDFEAGFHAGAEWRIDSVWHEASEQPKYDKTVLKHCLLDGDDAYKTSRNDNIMEKRSWDYWVVEDGLIEWAYIEDLIPTNE